MCYSIHIVDDDNNNNDNSNTLLQCLPTGPRRLKMRTHTHTRTHTHARKRTHARARTHARTHTHTHTHSGGWEGDGGMKMSYKKKIVITERKTSVKQRFNNRVARNDVRKDIAFEGRQVSFCTGGKKEERNHRERERERERER